MELEVNEEYVVPYYTSCIKINGRAILPPLMTSLRRKEMAEYRRQAVIAETRILRRKVERAHQLCKTDKNAKKVSCITPNKENSPEKVKVTLISEENNAERTSDSQASSDIKLINEMNTLSESAMADLIVDALIDDISINISKDKSVCENVISGQQTINTSEFYNFLTANICDNHCSYKVDNPRSSQEHFPDINFENHNSSVSAPTYIIVGNVINGAESFHNVSDNLQMSADNGIKNVDASVMETDGDSVKSSELEINGVVNESKDLENELQEYQHDSELLTPEQSTDLEKYMDRSSETSTTTSIQNTPFMFKFNSHNETVLSQDSSSLSNTLCLSGGDSSETLIAINNNNIDDKQSVNSISSDQSFNTFENDSSDFKFEYNSSTSVSEDNTENTVRCQVRKSSYTLEEPSPALLLAMEECQQVSTSVPSNTSILINSSMVINNRCVDLLTSEKLSPVDDIVMENVVNNRSGLSTSILQQNPGFFKSHEEDDNTCQLTKKDSNVFNEKEKNFHREEVGTLLNIKKTIEELFEEQEKNFENARDNLVKMQQQQMETLLNQQCEQWHCLLEGLKLEDKSSQLNSSMSLPELHTERFVGLVPETYSIPNSPALSAAETKNPFAVDEKKVIVSGIPMESMENKVEDQHINLPEIRNPEMQKFDRVSAAVKGYLTRRLMKTEHVQGIIQTIKDTLICALKFHQETPVKKGNITAKDAELHKRFIVQLTAACYDLHDVFFKLTVKERMSLISQSRNLSKDKIKSSCDKTNPESNKRQLSSATLKVLERKKLKSSTNIDGSNIKQKASKYHLKTPKRENMICSSPSNSSVVRKYVYCISPKQDHQKVQRKTSVIGSHSTSSVRKKLNVNVRK